ncbi:nicotinate-nucleotide--dimethylbenzimidazole phosphoribosyltransferase [Clostridium aminobutyricum]|uniref:Nicotinate-nucleotide--dimethylbenzimidazole phosphoribosyltransferase n=1 Tax=Clostridium aminobutyricum TaxID=33953 RepID=A0A939D6L6_CLOAM|nr:nicotinate-nucleotide--dimethylbenzimidazole phosphoribosyltransferase [Clostridium aminobutyricum]MBN7772065.1 nicotinate-nucleotide--dimethylbenzimidazole phosphoribosyltransferase [Clostridium aminobutyricum]
MKTLEEVLKGIRGADETAIEEAQKYMDCLIKPLGSLGKLEAMAVKMAGITGKIKNSVEKKCSIVMVADNGVCAEGVAGTPQDITLIQGMNMTKGICGMGVLSAHAGADIKVVDVGIMSDYNNDKVYNRKIKYGTDNFAKGPAMTREEAIRAIEIGIEMVEIAVSEGYQLIGTGEMGIGNTSSTSAVFMAMTGESAERAVGKGGGLTDEALIHKKQIITEAIKQNKPDPKDPVDVVSKVGGLDIAGLAGCFLGAAYFRVPIVIDGVISALSAYVAAQMNPLVKDFIFSSHKSKEPVYDLIFKELEMEPFLDMDMRLGEGTGCVLAFPIISAACAVMNMATFDDIKYDQSYRIDIRK